MTSKEPTLGEDERWSTVSFRVFSDGMPPEEIAAALGLSPTRSHRIGDLVSKRLTIVRKKHLFLIASPLRRSSPLEEHLIWLCDTIEPFALKLAAISDRCQADIFCGFSSGTGQGGFTLNPLLLARIAALNIQLTVDLYPPTIDRMQS